MYISGDLNETLRFLQLQGIS